MASCYLDLNQGPLLYQYWAGPESPGCEPVIGVVKVCRVGPTVGGVAVTAAVIRMAQTALGSAAMRELYEEPRCATADHTSRARALGVRR